jgi:hypothetical protein
MKLLITRNVLIGSPCRQLYVLRSQLCPLGSFREFLKHRIDKLRIKKSRKQLIINYLRDYHSSLLISAQRLNSAVSIIFQFHNLHITQMRLARKLNTVVKNIPFIVLSYDGMVVGPTQNRFQQNAFIREGAIR